MGIEFGLEDDVGVFLQGRFVGVEKGLEKVVRFFALLGVYGGRTVGCDGWDIFGGVGAC